MESKEQYPEQFEIHKEKYIEFAKQLAEILRRSETVKRVGIIGSAARGKEYPSDLDCVVLIDQGAYISYLLSNLFTSETKKRRYALDMQLIDALKKTAEQNEDKNFLLEQVLGLNREDAETLAILMFTEYPRPLDKGSSLPHIVVLPDRMKGVEGLVSLQIISQRDPTFLTNISADYIQFNPETGDFLRQPIYSEEEMAEIKGKEFKTLKEIISNPEHPMYEIWEEEARTREVKKYT